MTTPAERGETMLNLRRLPIDLKATFKAWCAERGWPMEVVVEALMLDCVERGRHLSSVVNRVHQQRRGRDSGRADSVHVTPRRDDVGWTKATTDKQATAKNGTEI